MFFFFHILCTTGSSQKERGVAVSHALQVLLDNFDGRARAKQLGEAFFKHVNRDGEGDISSQMKQV